MVIITVLVIDIMTKIEIKQQIVDITYDNISK